MRLTIVRHGETEENLRHIMQGHTHGRLSARGKEQARRLAARLKDEEFHAAYASDLGRAKHTANAILEHHDVPVTFTAQLRERDWGEMNGRPYGELKEPLFGESREDLERRAHAFFRKLGKHHGEHILIVSHNGFCSAFIAAIGGHTTVPDLSNASVTVIDIEGPRDTIRAFNCTQHL